MYYRKRRVFTHLSKGFPIDVLLNQVWESCFWDGLGCPHHLVWKLYLRFYGSLFGALSCNVSKIYCGTPSGGQQNCWWRTGRDRQTGQDRTRTGQERKDIKPRRKEEKVTYRMKELKETCHPNPPKPMDQGSRARAAEPFPRGKTWSPNRNVTNK